MAILYIEAFQATGNARYALVARGVLDDLLERFRMPGGGFASALDADTEGVEGLYYTWTVDEIQSVLGIRASSPFESAYFDMESTVEGRGVLRLRTDPRTLVVAQREFAESRQRLLEARRSRSAPLRDEKVLTSANALAVSALAKASQVLKDEHYLEVAQTEMMNLLGRAPEWLWLSHSRIGEWNGEEVFLDDYAFAIQALLDLYEADFDPSHLDVAARLMEVTIDRFYMGSGLPFRYTPKDMLSVIPTRPYYLEEQGLPSGNAAALAALLRLQLFGGSGELEGLASSILNNIGGYLDRSAMWSTGLLRAFDFRPNEAYEIVIVGRAGAKDTQDLLDVVRKELLHGVAVAVIEPDAPSRNENWPLLARRPMMDDLATAYVCQKRLCDLPVNTATALSSQLTKLVRQDSATTSLGDAIVRSRSSVSR